MKFIVFLLLTFLVFYFIIRLKKGEIKMQIKAVYFDRDNTLTKKNPEINEKLKSRIEELTKKPYVMDNNKMFGIFDVIKQKGFNCSSYENEVEFYKEYYKELLRIEGLSDEREIQKYGLELFNLVWLNDRVLFEDSDLVLKELKKMGIKVGIISDTTFSLQKTLEALGVGDYIDCYTSSKEAGVMKPDPIIYNLALKKLGLTAKDCVYVDDYDVEAKGAEKLGFKAFRINRNNQDKQDFDIFSLTEIVDFIKKQENEEFVK